MNRARRASPPNAWILALLLVLPLPLPLIAPIEFVEPAGLKVATTDYYRHDLATYFSTRRGDFDPPKGVMLAMSGGSCATFGPLQLSEGGVEMYVVTFNEATLKSFQALRDDLILGAPDFLVVQDAVIAKTRPSSRSLDLYKTARSYWVGQFRGIVHSQGTYNQQTVTDESWRCPWGPLPQDDWPEIVARDKKRVSTYSKQMHDKTMNFLGEFAASFPVLIVSQPRNEFTHEYSLEVFSVARALAGPQPTHSSVSFHRQVSAMSAMQFIDPLHLSPGENQPYRDWLNTEIVKVLEGRANQ